MKVKINFYFNKFSHTHMRKKARPYGADLLAMGRDCRGAPRSFIGTIQITQAIHRVSRTVLSK